MILSRSQTSFILILKAARVYPSMSHISRSWESIGVCSLVCPRKSADSKSVRHTAEMLVTLAVRDKITHDSDLHSDYIPRRIIIKEDKKDTSFPKQHKRRFVPRVFSDNAQVSSYHINLIRQCSSYHINMNANLKSMDKNKIIWNRIAKSQSEVRKIKIRDSTSNLLCSQTNLFLRCIATMFIHDSIASFSIRRRRRRFMARYQITRDCSFDSVRVYARTHRSIAQIRSMEWRALYGAIRGLVPKRVGLKAPHFRVRLSSSLSHIITPLYSRRSAPSSASAYSTYSERFSFPNK